MDKFNSVIIGGDKANPKDTGGFNSVSDTLIQKYSNTPIVAPTKTFKERLTDITAEQTKSIDNSAQLFKSGQQSIFSTLAQTLGASLKATGKSFALPVTIGSEYVFDVAGDLITKGREAQKNADEEAIMDGRLVRGRDFILSDQPKIEEQIAGLVKRGVEVGKPLIDKYNSLSDAQKAQIKAVTDTGQGAFDIFAALTGAKAGAKIIEKTGGKVFDVATGQFVTRQAENISDATVRAKDFTKEAFASKTSDEAVGAILQGKTDDIKLGAIALENIDTAGVKSFVDLNSRFKLAIPKFATVVDEELGKDATKYALENLKITKTAADIKNDPLLSKFAGMTDGVKEVKVDFVEKAFKDLSELYEKTNDIAAKTLIDDVLESVKLNGISRKEVNDLARIYGNEFSDKAFSKTGDALTSVNAQALENTRTGLKQVARAGLGGSEAKKADAVLESFYNTQRLIQKNIETVNKARQKFTDRSTLSKIGRVMGKTIDALSGGSIKGFLSGFIGRNVGNLQATSVDIEDALAYNLKIFRRALEAKNSKEATKIITEGLDPKNVQKGMLDEVKILPAKKEKIPKSEVSVEGGTLPNKKASDLVNPSPKTFKERVEEGYAAQENGNMYNDSYKLSFEDFVKKYEGYNYDEGGLSTGEKPAHDIIPKSLLKPTEISTGKWEDFRKGFTEKFDKEKAFSNVSDYYKKDFTPVLVGKDGNEFFVIDGHHRVANLLADGVGDIPVYYEHSTLLDIWNKANPDKKVNWKEQRALYKKIFPRLDYDVQKPKKVIDSKKEN